MLFFLNNYFLKTKKRQFLNFKKQNYTIYIALFKNKY